MRCVHCGYPDARSYGGRPKCQDTDGCLLRTAYRLTFWGRR